MNKTNVFLQMRISSNHIRSVISFFHSELHELYSSSEINRLVELVFEAYQGYSRSELLKRRDETVNESDLLRYNFAVKDLKRGRPVQYILGKAWFFDLELQVNEDVLIPRPETEELVQWITDDNVKAERTLTVFDAGTGSGCIALALASKLKNTHVFAGDVSESALKVAAHNAGELKLRITFLKMDMCDKTTWTVIPDCTIIASNPPYIKNTEAKAMASTVKDYEPHLALFVPDDDALIFYRQLAELGKLKLKPGGKMYVEVNEALGLETCILFQQMGYSDVQLRQDMSGKDRMVRATKT